MHARISSIKTDNHLSNLQLITTHENKKFEKNLDYSGDNNPRKNTKYVRAINLENNQFIYSGSMASMENIYILILELLTLFVIIFKKGWL